MHAVFPVTHIHDPAQQDAIHNTKHPQARAGQDGKMANVCVMHRRHITPGLQGSRAAGGR